MNNLGFSLKTQSLCLPSGWVVFIAERGRLWKGLTFYNLPRWDGSEVSEMSLPGASARALRRQANQAGIREAYSLVASQLLAGMEAKIPSERGSKSSLESELRFLHLLIATQLSCRSASCGVPQVPRRMPGCRIRRASRRSRRWVLLRRVRMRERLLLLLRLLRGP